MSEPSLNSTRVLEVLGVPLDLGGNRRGCDMGPSALRIGGLVAKLVRLGYEVRDQGDLPAPAAEESAFGDPRAKFLTAIGQVCGEVCARVERALDAGHLPLVVGGDHSIAMGTVSGVVSHHRKRDAEIGLMWVDAHADMNTPESSPSGNVHGMPLRVLLGQGPSSLVDLGGTGPKVRPEKVALIGIRDLDRREREVVAESGVHVFTMKEVDRYGMSEVAFRALEAVNDETDGFHLSLDLDSVDPQYAPGVGTPVPGGLTFREAHLLMELIADNGGLCSMEVVEHNPTLDHANKTAELGVNLVQSALGRQIL